MVDHITGVAFSCQFHGDRHDLGPPGANSVPDESDVGGEKGTGTGGGHEC